MKSFSFSLERVLSWRGTVLSLQEAKLEGLRPELHRLHDALDDTRRRRAESHAQFHHGVEVKGADLRTLQNFSDRLERDERHLLVCISQAQLAIEAQQQAVTRARRDVKLVERLRERRHLEWTVEADREIEEMAGEFAVSQWRRSH